MARKQDEWVIPEQSLELQQQLAALFKNFAPTFVRVGWLDAAPEVMLLVEVEREPSWRGTRRPNPDIMYSLKALHEDPKLGLTTSVEADQILEVLERLTWPLLPGKGD